MRLKKAILGLGIFFLFSVFCCASFSLIFHMDYMVKDREFSKIYGDGGLLPSVEVKLPTFLRSFHLYGQLGYFRKEGTIKTEEFEAPASFNQNFLSAGLEWSIRFGRTGIFSKGGLVFIRYQESALGVKDSDASWGFELGAGLSWDIFKNLFIVLEADYVHARERSERYDVVVKPGGFKAGLGIGLKI